MRPLAAGWTLMLMTVFSATTQAELAYPIVDTGQTICYDDRGRVIPAPRNPGAPFYGQDAQHVGHRPSYAVIADGRVVRDQVTGLFWTRSIDWDGNGVIDVNDKFTRPQLDAKAERLNRDAYGGRTDWRVPTVKQLYSLIQFNGVQPDPRARTGAGGRFFIDGSVFGFGWGDVASGDRIIDAQVWSSTNSTGPTMGGDASFFGVNFADGRIKAYPLKDPRRRSTDKAYYAMLVAGNPDYGVNDFQDHGDGTLTDRATGLMWTRRDSAQRMNWRDALAYVQKKNAANHLGHNDWRLPNAKELQSLADYARSPHATHSPAISPLFDLSAKEITARAFTPGGDYGYHWTGTTFSDLGPRGQAHHSSAVYVCFFEALGKVRGRVLDAHGAGAQRTDPKAPSQRFSPGDFHGPQGDYISINNYVLLVRDAVPPAR